jgi:CBS domain-containing protein
VKVQELMTRQAEACEPATDLAAVAMIMWRQDCGVVPIIDDERRVIGIITDRDICMAVATRHRSAEEINAGQVMSGHVFIVRPNDDVRAALEVMRRERVRRLPVVDGTGRLQGMLSINDVVLEVHEDAGPPIAGDISAADVIAVLQSICAHSAPTPKPERKKARVPAGA